MMEGPAMKLEKWPPIRGNGQAHFLISPETNIVYTHYSVYIYTYSIYVYIYMYMVYIYTYIQYTICIYIYMYIHGIYIYNATTGPSCCRFYILVFQPIDHPRPRQCQFQQRMNFGKCCGCKKITRNHVDC